MSNYLIPISELRAFDRFLAISEWRLCNLTEAQIEFQWNQYLQLKAQAGEG